MLFVRALGSGIEFASSQRFPAVHAFAWLRHDAGMTEMREAKLTNGVWVTRGSARDTTLAITCPQTRL